MFQDQLKKIAAQIDEIIRTDDFPGPVRPPALKKAVRAYPGHGGKRLRPALLMWACGLCGGNPAAAKFAAAAVEIYHNWTLVHDDLIDNDDFRRGRPATHKAIAAFAAGNWSLPLTRAKKFGADLAMLAGDLQQGWAVRMLLRSTASGVSPELTLALVRRLQELVCRELISGEALDVEYAVRNRTELKPAAIRTMLAMKTGALLRYAAEAGAAIALKTSDFQSGKVKDLGRFAQFAGTAFQLRDDWLGLFGTEQELGKPLCSDLAEGKPTLLLVSALAALNRSDRKELLNLVGRPAYSSREVQKIRTLVRASGAEHRLSGQAAAYADRAGNILRTGFPDNHYRQLLLAWTDYLVGRSK